jgi:hypothetical protein
VRRPPLDIQPHTTTRTTPRRPPRHDYSCAGGAPAPVAIQMLIRVFILSSRQQHHDHPFVAYFLSGQHHHHYHHHLLDFVHFPFTPTNPISTSLYTGELLEAQPFPTTTLEKVALVAI